MNNYGDLNMEFAKTDKAAGIPIFAPRMPSDDELRERAISYHETIGQTNLDMLPPAVLGLSPSTKFVDLPEGSENIWDNDKESVENLIAALTPLFDLREAFFFKLSSRSPKESHFLSFGVQTYCAAQAAGRMSMSERCLDDVSLYRHHPSYTLKACARKWVYGSSEFNEVRCFVRDGKFLAATQYVRPGEWDHDFWQSHQERTKIRERAESFWRDILHPKMHLETYVFDLNLSWRDRPLIEINPYGSSDPCALGSYDAVENFSGDVAFYPTPNEGEPTE